MKKIILAVAALSMFACSSDDATTEPIVENPVQQCDCTSQRFRIVVPNVNKPPVDTIAIGNINKLSYKRDCGFEYWSTDFNTVTQFGYETEYIKCGEVTNNTPNTF